MTTTDLEFTAARPIRIGPIETLLQREPTLAAFGLALLVLLVPASIAHGVDPRTLHGVGIWVKPMKFLASLGLFALTTAWFIGYLPAARRRALPVRALVWTLVATAGFEMAYIALQAARGDASHYNRSSPLFEALYGLMGIAAVMLIATALPLAREIARHGDRRLAPAFRRSIVIGLVLTFVLSLISGVVLSMGDGHWVGGVANDAGGVPVVGWSRTGGDLRPAHFLAVHAQQLIPLIGWVAAALLPARAGVAVWTGAAVYVAITAGLFVQALMGLPLIPA
ncbi:MAG: hypothetical protein AB7O45_00650 [Alphaproteobacteria bacterium]